jgi:hypothetical protein
LLLISPALLAKKRQHVGIDPQRNLLLRSRPDYRARKEVRAEFGHIRKIYVFIPKCINPLPVCPGSLFRIASALHNLGSPTLGEDFDLASIITNAAAPFVAVFDGWEFVPPASSAFAGKKAEPFSARCRIAHPCENRARACPERSRRGGAASLATIPRRSKSYKGWPARLKLSNTGASEKLVPALLRPNCYDPNKKGKCTARRMSISWCLLTWWSGSRESNFQN